VFVIIIIIPCVDSDRHEACTPSRTEIASEIDTPTDIGVRDSSVSIVIGESGFDSG
jgi:hypothetical protein